MIEIRATAAVKGNSQAWMTCGTGSVARSGDGSLVHQATMPVAIWAMPSWMAPARPPTAALVTPPATLPAAWEAALAAIWAMHVALVSGLHDMRSPPGQGREAGQADGWAGLGGEVTAGRRDEPPVAIQPAHLQPGDRFLPGGAVRRRDHLDGCGGRRPGGEL